ncbi:caspase family protein [Pseudomonas sp.]|uniref:caspase family protein n=1 Tax=Pseudomonas sp. TaxID=306 RepID=UPI002489EB39|nr:caspase family protein [Pseudomonas sp.]MDI1330902.1 caspase family protein [Pseudomonas sp.]
MPSFLFRIPTVVTAIALSIILPAMAEASDYTFEKPVKRLALLIANWNYDGGDLPGTELDQKAMKARLEMLNFKVQTISNFRNRDELIESIIPFLDQVQFGDFVVIYYSGHGLGYSAENYLVPTKLPKKILEDRFFDYFLSAEDIQRQIKTRQAGISLVIFDACRTFNTPEFLNTNKESGKNKEIEKGLMRPTIRLATNFVIGYAAEPGQAAISRVGEQSYFTQAITKSIDNGIYEFDELRRSVIDEVINSSRGKQAPWFLDSTTAVIRLRDTEQSLTNEKTSWINVLGSGAPDMVQRYIRTFPTSRYVTAAREWLRDNPGKEPIATTYLPPAIVAEAWNSSAPITVEFSDVSQEFKFPKNGSQSLKTAQAAQQYFNKFQKRGARQTLYLDASDMILTSKNQVVRATPSTNSIITDSVAAGTNIVFTKAVRDTRGHSWVLTDDKVTNIKGYISTPNNYNITQVTFGTPVAEGYARPSTPESSGLVIKEDVYKLIEQIKLSEKEPSWASLEVGTSECLEVDKERCALQSDLNALRLLHVESMLAAHGYARNKITSLTNVEDVPNNEVRIRLFANEEQP